MIKHVKSKNVVSIGFFDDIRKSKEEFDKFIDAYDVIFSIF